MRIVLALANTPYFSDVERHILQRMLDELGDYLVRRKMSCIACVTASVRVRFPDGVQVHRSKSSRDVIEQGDIVLTQYSTLIHDLRNCSNRIVLLNNKATSFLLTFPWVINHELQLAPVLDDVLSDTSPMQKIWEVVNDERVIHDRIAEVKPVGRVQWALKALIDRVR